MNVSRGDILTRRGYEYEVVCADEEVFVVGRKYGTRTSFAQLEAYPNNELVMSLKRLNFKKEDK